MSYEKIALVAIFLGLLIIVQTYLYLKRKDKENSNFPNHGLRVVSRLKLSKTADLDIVSAGSESFLIISNKNTQPTVIQLSQAICEESSSMKVSRYE
tara:strand:+ start:197 stop:487 length:291 start_codon:yes stop_codon:yes gene_type:complete